MILEIEDAKTYYCSPLDKENKTLIGDKNMMNSFARYLKEGDVLITAGVMGEECTLILDLDDKQIQAILSKAKSHYEKQKKINSEVVYLGEGTIVDAQ